VYVWNTTLFPLAICFKPFHLYALPISSCTWMIVHSFALQSEDLGQ